MNPLFLRELELALRWNISPKTLQRWRQEGRTPKYIKLSKIVVYAIEDVLEFEFLYTHNSTSERLVHTLEPYGPDLLSVRQITQRTGIPLYVFANPRFRKALKVPHTKVNAAVRFSVSEIDQWAIEWIKNNGPTPTPPDPITSHIARYTETFGARND